MSTTREALVRAALIVINDNGWADTSMESVRRQAGVSNGSMFHHFPTRRDLHAAVLAAALAEHQHEVGSALGTRRRLAAGIREAVLGHLRWLRQNPRIGLMLVTAQPSDLAAALTDEALERNQAFFRQVSDWLRERGWTGQPELPVLINLWLGPVNDYSRDRLGSGDPPEEGAGPLFAEAAWRALAPLFEEDA